MQIDGHHTATYVAARIAGFSFKEAEKISYAAQYVDDATNSGIVLFNNSDYLYSRIASAHKMVDYDNFVDVENHLAWIPFHFLPGNGGLPADQSPQGGELEMLVCKPDSHIARDMLRQAMLDRDKPRALHRLGIAMHVYADTFAHQGFVGSLHLANQASAVTSGDEALDTRIKDETRKELLHSIWGNLKSFAQVLEKTIRLMVTERKWPGDFVASFLKKSPVGHAAVDVYPDQPYLQWTYLDHKGQSVIRNNPQAFMEAIDMMVRAMRAWRGGDTSMELESHPGLDGADRLVVERLFRETTDIDGEKRRSEWIRTIARGEFSFGSEVPSYIGKGPGSWKDMALGTDKTTDTGFERFDYKSDFITSDWKLFHDALQVHRSDVVHEVLPRYGICAA